jgi:hypothetical protein
VTVTNLRIELKKLQGNSPKGDYRVSFEAYRTILQQLCSEARGCSLLMRRIRLKETRRCAR